MITKVTALYSSDYHQYITGYRGNRVGIYVRSLVGKCIRRVLKKIKC